MAALVLDNPFLESLGATLTAWRAGYAEISLVLAPAHMNRQRVLQGGVVATLLDAACGYAGLFSPAGEPLVHGFGLSLTINYLEKGRGDKVVAKGMLDRRGRSIFFARGEVWLDDQTLIATAQGTFKYVGQHAGKSLAPPAVPE